MRHMPVSSENSPPSWSGPGGHRADLRPASPAARAALALLRAYKVVVSPWFAGSCRFVPSCADYMTEAIVRHGAARGIWLGTRRLSRCHPLGGHGLDPVPPAAAGSMTHSQSIRLR